MKKQTPALVSHPELSSARKARIVENLLRWYRANKRDLPWRGGSAYAVWVSEIMLQQTQVATVIPYFLRFMERFPALEALASAPIDDVLQQWAGLGYYARARNLHHAAIKVVTDYDGRIPNTTDAIETLPGIGRYTAGAILSIAYNVPRPLVDANVIRVLSRLFGLRGDPKSSANQALLWSLAEQLVPTDHPGDFNQGLMELGALICRPDDPLCEQCPLLSDCVAGNSPDPTAWPEIPPGRATVTVSHSSAIVVKHRPPQSTLENGSIEVLLVQRPPHGLWGGLWEFPRVVCEWGEPADAAAVRAARDVAGLRTNVCERLIAVTHAVTHHKITLHGCLVRASPPEQEPVSPLSAVIRWVAVDDLDGFALSAPQSLLRDALRRRFDPARLVSLQATMKFDE